VANIDPVPYGLKRFHESKQTHFITFSCYRRMRLLNSASMCRLFLDTLEEMRCRFGMRVYGYIVMPEHVHLLLSEPDQYNLAVAIHWLKLTSSKRASALRGGIGQRLWQSRYYDHNVVSYEKFVEKLRYIHRNPVKRSLCEKPEGWPWSSFRHYSDGESCPVKIESERTARDRALSVTEQTQVND